MDTSVSNGETVSGEVLADAARRVTTLVGDGCVVRLADDDGISVVAVDHVESRGRQELENLLLGPRVAKEEGWLAQALERRQAVRLPSLDQEALAAIGLPPRYRAGDVMIVPLPTVNALLVAVRDHWSDKYTGANRRQVERIAADVEAELGEFAPLPDLSTDNRRRFDPIAYGLLEATSSGLWVVDQEARTVYVNGPASELVGRPAAELVGEPISEYLSRVSQSGRGGFHGTEVIERPLMRADGSVVWVLSSKRPLREGDFGADCVLYTLAPFGELHERDVSLRLRLARTEALLELAEEAGAGVEFSRLLSNAVHLIADQLDVELAGVGTFDLERLEGRPLAVFGWPESVATPADADSTAVSMVERSATVAALRFDEPILVWDYETQSIYDRDPLLERLGIRSAAIVPFAGGTAAVGAHSPRPGAIDGEGLALLQTVARLIAPRWRIAGSAVQDSTEPPPSAAE